LTLVKAVGVGRHRGIHDIKKGITIISKTSETCGAYLSVALADIIIIIIIIFDQLVNKAHKPLITKPETQAHHCHCVGNEHPLDTNQYE
jgi:hypothetical protein